MHDKFIITTSCFTLKEIGYVKKKLKAIMKKINDFYDSSFIHYITSNVRITCRRVAPAFLSSQNLNLY